MNSPCKTNLIQLRKRSEFVAMRGGQRIHTSSFVLQVRKRNGEPANCNPMRVGYTVTKKIGNAVIRNRIKRRLRQVARLSLLTDGVSGHDYVLIAKRMSLNNNFEVLTGELRRALVKAGRGATKSPAQTNYNQAGYQNGQ